MLPARQVAVLPNHSLSASYGYLAKLQRTEVIRPQFAPSPGVDQGIVVPFILFMPFMVNPASPPEVMLLLSAPLRETILILLAFAFFAALREMRFLVVRLSEEWA